MPRINLLPLKQTRREALIRKEFNLFIVASIVVLVCLSGWYVYMQVEIEVLSSQLGSVAKDLNRLKKEVATVEKLRKKEEKVKNKLSVIDKLIANKTGPAKMLDDLAIILTNDAKRLWLTELSQSKDGLLTLRGGSTDHENISAFQLALQSRPVFSNIKLKRVSTSGGARGSAPHLKWELSCNTSYRKGDKNG
jgi:type IV pilus assembly protein PilN